MATNEVSEYSGLLEPVQSIAREAGVEILRIYARDFAAQLKEDRSPLTEADSASHSLIVDRLAALGGFPVLSEESPAAEIEMRRSWQTYWLVDPLDGTKEFLKRNGEFTVNIALVHANRAVLGVVYAPALDDLFFGVIGRGAWREHEGRSACRINVQASAAKPIRVVSSRSHPSPEFAAYVAKLGARPITIGSSLKICLVACGEADVYPRLGPTSEWDTAAAQAVLESAGGHMTDLDGRPLRYNLREDLLNPHFIAYGDPRRDWLEPAAGRPAVTHLEHERLARG